MSEKKYKMFQLVRLNENGDSTNCGFFAYKKDAQIRRQVLSHTVCCPHGKDKYTITEQEIIPDSKYGECVRLPSIEDK